jgi:toxin CcdB
VARFDVFRLPGGALALDCQSDLLDHLASRFTVPLVAEDTLPARIPGLHPSFEIDGTMTVMATHLAGAIPVRAMADKIVSLAEHEYVIQRALDTLSGSY